MHKISGWANTNFSYSSVHVPETVSAIFSIIEEAKESGTTVLPRGSGQSYGDESLNDKQAVIDLRKINQVVEWDAKKGLLQVQAGATYEDVLTHCLKDNWTLAVIPGTRFVTMGGALANNVHGKNSYAHGNFGAWVQEFKIILASGEHLSCSRKENSDLFFAAIGGAGLLGIVTEMTLQLIRIPSPYLAVEQSTAPSLEALLDKLERESKKNDFAIAQVDCFAEATSLGRGTIHVGSFAEDTSTETNIESLRNIPQRMFGVFPKKWIPAIGKLFLNNYTMKWISRLKYYLDKMENVDKRYRQDIFQFTFLLDRIPNWKKVFQHGFFEYEPLVPKDKAREVFSKLIALTHEFGMPAYLSAIKIHTPDNFLLSYSMNGYSLGLDIPQQPKKKASQDELFRKMNEVVIGAGGIVYLAKDATLTSLEFRQMYKVEEFLAIKKKYDPSELFQSDMYRRIFK